MKTFKTTKSYICKRAKELQACSSEYKKALESKTFDELIEILRENAGWVITEKLLDDKLSIKYFDLSLSNLFNSGLSNSGHRNSGHRNSGHRNSGHSNSGDWNSGHRNSGHSNSGDWNTGYRNSGDWNTGHRNSGHSNSGDWNTGHRNSGDSNSGDWNSGYSNSGHSNSGDSNSGHSNSGDSNSGDWNNGFFNSTKPKTINVFNKDCDFGIWEKAKKPDFIYNILLNKWVSFSNMTDEEKIQYPKAFVCDGYLKTYSYKEAWNNAYKRASKEDVELLKALPNFDSETFEEITGIKC